MDDGSHWLESQLHSEGSRADPSMAESDFNELKLKYPKAEWAALSLAEFRGLLPERLNPLLNDEALSLEDAGALGAVAKPVTAHMVHLEEVVVHPQEVALTVKDPAPDPTPEAEALTLTLDELTATPPQLTDQPSLLEAAHGPARVYGVVTSDKKRPGCLCGLQWRLLIWMAFSLALPIAMIELGMEHKDSACEEDLSLWLLVLGGVSVGSFFLQLVCRPREDPETGEKKAHPLIGCILCFSFAWVIVGCVWTFGINRDSHVCPDAIYDFSYYYLIIVLCVCPVVCVCMTCGIVLKAGRDVSHTPTTSAARS